MAGTTRAISRHPLRQWHSFAVIPTPGTKGFRMTVSRAGDWTSDCGGTVSIRADGTATVTDLPIHRVRDDAGGLRETKAGGEYTWRIVPESDAADQEVRFATPQDDEEVFSAHAERDWTGFDNLEYYLSTPSEPIYCVLSR